MRIQHICIEALSDKYKLDRVYSTLVRFIRKKKKEGDVLLGMAALIFLVFVFR